MYEKTHRLPVLPFNHELVLQHDQVTFSLLVIHQIFQPSAQGVKKVSCSGLHLIRREETDPSEAGNDSTGFKFIRELDHLLDACD